MTTPTEVRRELVEFLHRDLIGPAGGPNEELSDPPSIRYVAGVLFPRESIRDESNSSPSGDGSAEHDEESDNYRDDEDADNGGEFGDRPPAQDDQASKPRSTASAEADHDDTVTLANTYRPSAMSLSFLVAASCSRLKVQARAGIYTGRKEEVTSGDKVYKEDRWNRVQLEIREVEIDLAQSGVKKIEPELAPGLSLRATVRKRDNGASLVTISLCNMTNDCGRSGTTFFQSGFDVEGVDSACPFVEYGLLNEAEKDEEENALAMLYRERREYAVGHGCAAEWDQPADDAVAAIRTAVLPTVVVPPVTPVSNDANYLNMEFLSGRCSSPESAIPNALRELCAEYDRWINELRTKSADFPHLFQAPARKHIRLCTTALKRMSDGIELIEKSDLAREAFCLMNRSMLMQQVHSKRRIRKISATWEPLPQREEDYGSEWAKPRGFWRSFQIAFILMTMPGVGESDTKVEIEDEVVESRDLVDLIWFPTGGGKTEAYLGLAAFAIFSGRLRDPAAEGCKILMRYTLRLLTSQQFQRASSLICACELIRRSNPVRFGSSPITIGLWVGLSLTPNKEKDALSALSKLSRKKPNAKNPFQLLTCPWCGTELDDAEQLGYSTRGNRMVFVCPAADDDGQTRCPFSQLGTHLPVVVVDDSIYKNPPTLIIGTVDKFAILAWKAKAGAILTHGGGPELIIQDELHLITGPLGSMVGLYEGVIEYLCSLGGRRPKIVASTATIRRADEQCRALYDRRMFQFPPAGLDASDSYFAKEDQSKPGRMYVGLLPTASSSPLTAQIRTVVALQQGAPLAVADREAEELLDPYWTLVQYFGSLKELGRAATFVTADIPEFLPAMHRRYSLSADQKRWMNTSEELTSRKNEHEIPKILKRLEVRYSKNGRWESQALDTVLATNMISVGVDVDRLGTMLIVTQPKGTAEYIQASSRVGRSDEGPGLVLTLYNASRPRDRSHYEHFKGFHEAFYRHVEPSTVTPFSPPALERALGAILIIAGRHIAQWQNPTDIDLEDSTFCGFLTFLNKRADSIDKIHSGLLSDLVSRMIEEWSERDVEDWGSIVDEADGHALMKPAGSLSRDEYSDVWDVPTSMRNVDVECQAEVISLYYDPEEN